MKNFFAILFLSVLLMSCAAPTPAPTAAPPTKPPASSVASSSAPSTKSPAPSATPIGRTPVAPAAPVIAIQNAQTQKQPDGSIRTTAQVTAAGNLGLGQIELAYPDTLSPSESRTVRLKLAPAQQLASLTPSPILAKTPDLPKFIYKFGGNVDLYPLMIAELRALKFDVKPTGAQRRTVDPTKEVVWDWLISPTAPGKHDLSIELSIPAIVNGVEAELGTDVLKNLAFTIDVVKVEPSPVARIIDSIINNAGPLLIALIGLVGTLIGILAKMQSDKSKATRSTKK